MRQPYWWGMVLVLLLASATRLHQLDTRSLWEDEGWTLVLAQGPTIPDIVQRMAFDQHPPLYFVFIHLWRGATGNTEFALRMLSVLTGIIAVAGIYQLGRHLFNPLSGLMAALFLALSDHHIDLSQDVRHYAQLTTLIILSTWYYFRLIQTNQPSRATRIGYVLISVALLYSHYLGGFVLICHAVHLLVSVRPLKKLWWVGFHFGAVCLAFLPWLPIVIHQNQVRWKTPLYYLNALPNNHQTYVMVRDALVGKQFGLTLALLLLGLVWLSYHDNQTRLQLRPLNPTIFALGWLISYISMTVYLNERNQFLTIRNFIVVTPVIALLVGHGLANLQLSVRGFLVGVLCVVALTTVDTRQLKPPWREVVQTVTDYHNPDEPILMDIWVGDFPARYYIERQMGVNTPWLSIRESLDAYGEGIYGFLFDYLEEHDTFWLIYWKTEPVNQSFYAGVFRESGFQPTTAIPTTHAGDQIYAYRYDRVSDTPIAQFGEWFVLQKAAVLRSPDTITIQLIWSVLEPPPLDYSVSVFALDAAGNLLANQDDSHLIRLNPTSRWEVGQLIFDQRELPLFTEYSQIGVKVYYYQAPNEPLAALCYGESCEWLALEK